MPKEIHPDLADCLRRPNPYIHHHVEISVPDMSAIARRPDQWAAALASCPDIVIGASGGIELRSHAGTLAEFSGLQSHFDLNIENEGRRLKGLLWKVDSKFTGARLRTFSAKIKRVGAVIPQIDFELQIFSFSQIPGVRTVGTVETSVIRYIPTPLLNPAPVLRASDITWTANTAPLVFQAQQYAFRFNSGTHGPSSAMPGESGYYLFSIRPLKLQPGLTGVFQWPTDTLTFHDVADEGRFSRAFWARDKEDEEWVLNDFADTPNSKIEIDVFVPSATFLI